jgi:hypothetical protein
MNANAARSRSDKEVRRIQVMKRVIEVLGWLTAVAILAFASHSVFAAGAGQSQSDSIRRARTARERQEDLSPASIMRDARTLYVAPSEHVEKKYLEYKLHKYPELEDWGLMLVADASAADLVLTVDKTALNYIFTITDRRTSVIVTSGKCVAVNGRLAAEYLGKEIIKKIRDARASGDGGRRHNRRHARDDDADDDESESSS